MKIGLTPLTRIVILQANVPSSTSLHSLGRAGKPMDISLPALLWSYETIFFINIFACYGEIACGECVEIDTTRHGFHQMHSYHPNTPHENGSDIDPRVDDRTSMPAPMPRSRHRYGVWTSASFDN